MTCGSTARKKQEAAMHDQTLVRDQRSIGELTQHQLREDHSGLLTTRKISHADAMSMTFQPHLSQDITTGLVRFILAKKTL
jgi:hypothetical protein